MKIDLLDHGYVRLVDSMGGDLSVVRAARISYDAEWRAGDDEGSDNRLIRYLAKNNHSTPFEAVEFQFEVKAPIFVFRQWHRHRTWSYNELSARYRELSEEFYIPEAAQVTTQHESNKQMRTDTTNDHAETIRQAMVDQNKEAFRVYRDLIEKNCPRELARSILPVSTYTHMFAKVNLLNLIRFLKLRNHDHAQYEIRVYADAMQQIARTVAPVSISNWFD